MWQYGRTPFISNFMQKGIDSYDFIKVFLYFYLNHSADSFSMSFVGGCFICLRFRYSTFSSSFFRFFLPSMECVFRENLFWTPFSHLRPDPASTAYGEAEYAYICRKISLQFFSQSSVREHHFCNSQRSPAFSGFRINSRFHVKKNLL